MFAAATAEASASFLLAPASISTWSAGRDRLYTTSMTASLPSTFVTLAPFAMRARITSSAPFCAAMLIGQVWPDGRDATPGLEFPERLPKQRVATPGWPATATAIGMNAGVLLVARSKTASAGEQAFPPPAVRSIWPVSSRAWAAAGS